MNKLKTSSSTAAQENEKPWAGRSRWPDDAFVAGVFSLDPLPAGDTPTQEMIEKITKNPKELRQTCCAILMSANHDTFCKYRDREARFPMYMYWRVRDMPKANDLAGLNEWSFLKIVDGVDLNCTSKSCKAEVPEKGLTWAQEELLQCDERDRAPSCFAEPVCQKSLLKLLSTMPLAAKRLLQLLQAFF